MRLRPILTGVAGLLLVITATAGGAGARTASGLCAYHDSTTRDGLVATATIHVVQDNCQVSFVSIMKFWDGNAIYKTATGTFAASDTRVKLSVLLPCDQGSETDVVLGPPTLYPLGDLDLGATAFDVACPAGGGGGGGGGTTSYPDLAATVTAARKSPVRIGDTVPLTVTVKNNGAAGAGGVHVLISLSPNSILRGTATASRGPGCTGVTFLDCNLGSVGAGSVTTVQLAVSAASGKHLFIGAQVQEIENDATLADNTGTLHLSVLPRLSRLALSVRLAGIKAHEQLAYVALTRSARVTAQVYVHGHATPIRWRRSLDAGTFLVRIPLPQLASGERFVLVLRAANGASRATVRLPSHN